MLSHFLPATDPKDEYERLGEQVNKHSPAGFWSPGTLWNFDAFLETPPRAIGSLSKKLQAAVVSGPTSAVQSMYGALAAGLADPTSRPVVRHPTPPT
jgi:hypothetical protein